ncbi:MAG: transglycosylase domain-containing protein [Deltaproteobacteria bacterium]|nr:transglycosylase domain-containing protein [Deltaproteobacteria bacterium]
MQITVKILLASFFLMMAGLAVPLGLLYKSLPDPSSLKETDPKTTSFIQGKCRLESCPLSWSPLSGMPSFVPQAIVLAEDTRFFSHNGIDRHNILRALKINIRSRKIVWGGSSITMQLAKNLYLKPDKTLGRKLAELVLTYKLEKTLSKERILELYLNVAEWGPNLFGIGNASLHYFHKEPSQLRLEEAAFLASLLPNPSLVADGDLPDRFLIAGSFLFEELVKQYQPVVN